MAKKTSNACQTCIFPDSCIGFFSAASAKVGILYLRASPEGSRNSVGFSGVVGFALLRSGDAHDGDAWWLVRLGVEVVVYNVYIYLKKYLVPVFF